jgi:hypothetical protein
MCGLTSAAAILSEDPRQPIVLYSASFTAADREQAELIGVTRCFDKRDLDCLPDLVRRLGTRRVPDRG